MMQIEKKARRTFLDVYQRRNLPDYRKGKDSSADEMMSVFHLKQFFIDSRFHYYQIMVNAMYDSLMDLSFLLGIEPSLIGMQNQLSICTIYGHLSDDSEKNAGFEPASDTIYLTRHLTDLAHEMAHALEFKVLRKRECRPYKNLKEYLEDPETEYAESSCLKAYAYAKEHENHYRMVEFNENGKWFQKEYWTSEEEMLARAGEAYISHLMHEKNALNTMLAKPYEQILGSMEYPHGADNVVIYACMDAIIKEIKGEQ